MGQRMAKKKRRNLKMIPCIDGVAVIFKWE